MIINVKEYPGFYEACKTLKKSGSLYTKVLCCNNGWMYSTDTNVLVRCQAPENVNDSFYTVESLNKTKAVIVASEPIEYPNMSFLFHEEKHIEIGLSTNIGLILYQLAIQADTALDPAVLGHVVSNINNLENVSVIPTGNNPVTFKFEGKWSLVVMPLMVKKLKTHNKQGDITWRS